VGAFPEGGSLWGGLLGGVCGQIIPSGGKRKKPEFTFYFLRTKDQKRGRITRAISVLHKEKKRQFKAEREFIYLQHLNPNIELEREEDFGKNVSLVGAPYPIKEKGEYCGGRRRKKKKDKGPARVVALFFLRNRQGKKLWYNRHRNRRGGGTALPKGQRLNPPQ